MPPMTNPTGRHRKKRRHHGSGTVVHRTDHWRAKPWAGVVPYVDAQGRRREMWLSAASRAEADDLRLDELARLRKGIVRTEQTVGEYVNAWLADVEVGPGTWPRYRAHITERIEPTLGSIALRLLTPQHVRSALIRWEGAPATRAGALRLLRAAMKQAVTDRRIEHDPTAGIPYPRTARREAVTLTAAEAKHLMATVKGERFAPILAVSLGLGVRRGEALGLRTQDINWEEDDDRTVPTLRTQDVPEPPRGAKRRGRGIPPGPAEEHAGVRPPASVQGGSRMAVAGPVGMAMRSVRDGSGARPVSVTIAKGLRYIAPSLRAEGEGPYRLTGTKTGETRVVPLPAFVADALRDRLAELEVERRAKVYAPNDFVFCDRFGNSVPLETLRTWFLGALKRAGLAPVRWHSLRATTITLLLDMGVDLLTIQKIVGHKDLATTKRYVGKTPAAMQGAADKLGEAMG